MELEENDKDGAPSGEESALKVSDTAKEVSGEMPGIRAEGTAKRYNRMLIALIVVSVLAAMLLASTITLAVVGDFSGKGGGQPSLEQRRPPLPRRAPGEYREWRQERRLPRERWRDQQQDEQEEEQGGQEDGAMPPEAGPGGI